MNEAQLQRELATARALAERRRDESVLATVELNRTQSKAEALAARTVAEMAAVRAELVATKQASPSRDFCHPSQR